MKIIEPSVELVEDFDAVEMFGKLLRERNIIDRKILAEDVIADNELELRGDKIFLNKEASE